MKKVIIVLLALMLCACNPFEFVDEEYITNYLNEKYGDDIEFTPLYKSSCKLFEAGVCRASYTASDLDNMEIHVIWTEKSGLDMKDDYLFKKYDQELKNYYTNILRDSAYRFKISEISNKSDYAWHTNLTFDDFIKYENLNSGISINIANANVDLTSYGESIKGILKEAGISNVASLYITNYNEGCNLDNTSECSKVNSIYIEVKIVEFYDENAKKS